jgi:hypothetical protein
LRVENSPPAGSVGISPAPLQATAITLSGASADRILISDAIPEFTTLDKSFLATAHTVTINGVEWTRVYSTAVTTVGPLAAGQNWIPTSNAAFAAAAVTRIGYIANGPLAAGSTTTFDATGFQFRVITSGVTSLPVNINNIAQVFGQTQPPGTPISATNPLVYDESGDQNPNNYEAGVAPAPITTPGTSPNGIANPATDGTDPDNDNSGTGAGGEANSFPINPVGVILNGPPGQPAAVGPDGTAQTDFVNKSAPVPEGAISGSSTDPAPVTFTNTVQNPASNINTLDRVTLEPISPLLAAQAVNNNASPSSAQVEAFSLTDLDNHEALPENTVVRISFGGRTAVYTLNAAGEFVLTSSGTTASDGTSDAPASRAPIIIPSLALGVSQNYTVTVDLPNGALVTRGYSVPIVAYVNSSVEGGTFKRSANNGTGAVTLTQDEPFNIKMDRVYTGYLDLLKESRVLTSITNPTPVAGSDGNFSIANKTPAPGNIIEYRITYSNISTPLSGSGNVVLNANNIVITEDGSAGTNNWATTTFNVASTAVDATAGAVVTFFEGATATTTTNVNVTRYVDSIPTLAPNAQGIFTFQRVVR